MGAWGALYLSGSRENYWNRSQSQNDLSLRYSGPTLAGISWSLDWTQRQWIGPAILALATIRASARLTCGLACRSIAGWGK
nr:fimbria/pilus outer membrane usher protein [Edwardsiella hoshinae]